MVCKLGKYIVGGHVLVNARCFIMDKILQFVHKFLTYIGIGRRHSNQLGDILKWEREEVNKPEQVLNIELGDILKQLSEEITKLHDVLKLEQVLNKKQCINLVTKLDKVVDYVRDIILSTKETSNIFELVVEELCCITRKVGVLVQDCGKQEWCHAVIFQMNNREGFRELVDDLKCCWDAMCTRYLAIHPDLQNNNIPSIDFEVATCDEIETDEKAMVDRLRNQIQRMPNDSEDYDLARHLWRRLEFDLQRSQGAELDGLEIPKHAKKPELLKRIGCGGAGEVYVSSWLGLRSATKVVNVLPNFCKEVGILACLSHPNLIKFICCGRLNEFVDDSIPFVEVSETHGVSRDLFLVMELMETSLSGFLKQQKEPFPYLVAINIMYEIARGMCYLHDMHVAHLDLKPDNVLLSSVSRLAGVGRNIAFDFVKLTDYDTSKTEVESKPKKQEHTIGTPKYMAPEMNNTKDNLVSNVASPFQADVWSFAMTCSEILSLKEPFLDTTRRNDILQRIKDGLRPELPMNCKELTMLIKECWVEDPSQRPTIFDICERLASLKKKFLVGTYQNDCPRFDKDGTPSPNTQLQGSNVMTISASKKVDEQRTQHEIVFGLENKLENVGLHLNQVNVLGLIGMGGIGKTTLAKAIFDDMKSTYDTSRFIENLKNKSSLEILCEIFGSEKETSGELVHAQNRMRKLLASKKILLILDDPKDVSQVDDVIPTDVQDFKNGTKIIITTREWGVIKNRVDVKGRIDVGKLDDNAAKKLFDSKILMDGAQLSPQLYDLRNKIIERCNGLPLSLKIMGAFLRGKERIRSWERAFQRMKRGRHLDGDEGLWSTLRISFDGLESNDKNMFLDIACFYPFGRRQRRELSNYGIYPTHGVDVLLDKALAKRYKNGFLEMHDQLCDMGRMIAETYEYRGSRIWKTNMIPFANGSADDKKKYEKVEAIYLDEDIFQHLFNKSMGIGELDLSSLRLLICSGLKTSLVKFKNITSLTTIYFMKCLPEGLGNLTSLTTLNVHNFLCLQKLPEELWNLTSLTTLNMHECSFMKTLPEGLGNLTSLTTLDLRECQSLRTLPEGLGNLISLRTLDLGWCWNLTTLPEGLGNLICLTTLNLYECYKLTTLPEGLGNLTSLTTLVVHQCYKLTTLPEGLGNLTSLITLVLQGCSRLTTLPKGLGNLISLTSLNLDNSCWKLETLPEGLSNLTSLKTLDLQGFTYLRALPEGLGNLTSLTTLDLKHCLSLTTLPEVLWNLTSLTTLDLVHCTNLRTLPEGLGNLTSLTTLGLERCHRLTTLPEGLGNLTSLTTLDMNWCMSLTTLPEGLGNLMYLKVLDVHECSKLTKLPEALGNMTSLTTLDLHKCSSLSTMPKGLANLTSLTTLDLHECSSLTTLPQGLGNLISLKTLDLRLCSRLTTLPEGLRNLTSLRTLDVNGCSSLRTLPDGVGNLTSLTSLGLFG